MGVRLMNLASGDSVVGLARNAESLDSADDDQPESAAAELMAGGNGGDGTGGQ
jgi:DNA gyrase subunit A